MNEQSLKVGSDESFVNLLQESLLLDKYEAPLIAEGLEQLQEQLDLGVEVAVVEIRRY